MVSRNFRQTHLLEVGLMQIPVDHAPLSKVRHVGLHVDFSSMNFFFGPISLHLLVWSELGRGSSFLTNESSYIAMVKGLQRCVWSGPYPNPIWFDEIGPMNFRIGRQPKKSLHRATGRHIHEYITNIDTNTEACSWVACNQLLLGQSSFLCI